MALTALVFTFGCVGALAAGWALALSIRKRAPELAESRWLPGVLLLLPLLPIAWDYQQQLDRVRTSAGGLVGSAETLGLAVPFGVLALWWIGALGVRRLPLIAIGFPILVVFLYLRFVLTPLLGPPQNLTILRETIALLLGAEALATCAIFGVLWGLLGLVGTLRRWPMRSR